MKQKSMLGTLTVYNSKKEVSYQAHIDKSELDDTIRNYKEEGRRLEGVFYLNGEVDVIIPSRGFTEQTVRIVFTPDNVSRETSQIKWEAGIDPSEWLMKEAKALFEIQSRKGKSTITVNSSDSPRNLEKVKSIVFIDDIEPSEFHKKEVDRLSNELQVSSFIQQRFTKHF